ncbi:unnamed protein product [Orchesella dallaii]|uniref:Uncharacterized protein n=1 Tax=Orchesella dallaii TaxID=48710 RepID=A0ABP1Q0G2_9HEXA
MALPNAKRPKIVDDELREELEAKRRRAIVIKVDKHKLFMDIMKAWYLGLRAIEKSRLSPKQLKRRAILVCYRNRIIYKRLPLNWVNQLRQDVGMKLYIKKKKTPEGTATAGEDAKQMPAEVPKKINEADLPINRRRSKRFLDLSSEIPPPAWLHAYAKGIVLPRVLRLYSAQDLNILYYDYAPKLVDANGNEYKLRAQPRHDFLAKILIAPKILCG